MSRISGRVSTRDVILSGSLGVQKEINLEELTATENGEYEPSEEYDGFSKVTVEVPIPILDDITITENGHYTPPEGVDGYDDITVNVPAPAPKLLHLYDEVTENGNHVYIPSDYGDYDGFSQVNMVTNVPIRVHDKTFTANGVYPPEANYDGYATVTVNVPTAAVIESKTITTNGTYTAPSGIDGYSPITVDVDGFTIKTLPGTPTPIASFNDGTSNPLKSLTASIEPVQDLHGYDSPWAGGAGKNKLNANNKTISEGDYVVNNVPIVLSAGTYTFSFDFSGSGVGSASSFRIDDSNGTAIFTANKTVANGKNSIEITLTSDGSFVKYFSNAVGSYSNLMIEAGSSATTFAPYSNICPISGWTEETITVKDDLQNPTVTHTTTIPFTDGQGQSVEVYGGNVDVVNGVVTPCPYYASYNGEQLTGEWISDRDVYSPNTSPTIGAQVVNIGATDTPFSVQPTSIKSLDGENNVFASTGDVEELKYFAEL